LDAIALSFGNRGPAGLFLSLIRIALKDAVRRNVSGHVFETSQRRMTKSYCTVTSSAACSQVREPDFVDATITGVIEIVPYIQQRPTVASAFAASVKAVLTASAPRLFVGVEYVRNAIALPILTGVMGVVLKLHRRRNTAPSRDDVEEPAKSEHEDVTKY
jgi:hypothetical protein